MSVLIKNMKMPSRCFDCTFSEWSNLHQTKACNCGSYYFKPCFEDYSEEFYEKRADFCPLVEVPYPHGDKNKKLKPCPFCGGDGAMLIKYGGEYKIFCGTAECDAQFGWCDDKEHVIKSWNHRSNVVGNTKNKTSEARWIINSDSYYPYCSACMTEPQNGEMTDYCPNCGAKMKK